jgi:ABC-type transport system involved in multi-copper enzyme maturation permease subunit
MKAAKVTSARPPFRQKPPTPIRANTVFMGRTDFVSTLLRLIGVELYKFRRRRMGKVFTVICLATALFTFGGIGSVAIVLANSSARSYLPPPCAPGQSQGCLSSAPTASQLAQAQQDKLESVRSTSDALRLPQSFSLSVEVARDVGLLLVIILAGTIVGGEYTFGTVRLMLTRGPTRTQFLCMKIGAILVWIVLGFLAIVLLGIVTGAVFNLATGIPATLTFLTPAWMLHVLLYMLLAMLGLFTYAMLALFLSTLGRATAAGVAGALAWALLEPAIGGTLSLLGSFSHGLAGRILRAAPDYLIGNNITALLQNQSHYLTGDAPSSLSDLHALLVLFTYLVIFIGIAWWSILQRDVTN